MKDQKIIFSPSFWRTGRSSVPSVAGGRTPNNSSNPYAVEQMKGCLHDISGLQPIVDIRRSESRRIPQA